MAAALLGVVFLLGATSCTVPLAPGYSIVKESRDVRFIQGAAPELHVSAAYTLQNSGTTDLSFMDVTFPDEKLYGRTGLRVTMNGQEVTLQPLPEEYRQSHPNTLRISFNPAWTRKERRTLTVEYSFVSPADLGARITLGEDNFHLSSRGWAPLPQPPNRVLSPYPARPPNAVYTVRVPADFLVLARGTPAGRKKVGSEIESRFRLRKGDLPPYIVAGRYVDSAGKSARQSAATFWTMHALKEDPSVAAQRIATAWAALQKDFGPLDKNILEPRVVESPELRAWPGAANPSAAASFPGGALVNAETLALGLQSDEFVQEVNEALARSWFGDEMYPAPDAAVGIGEGLSDYATIVVDQAAGGEPARRHRIQEFLRAYEAAVQRSAGTPDAEKTIVTTMLYDPYVQRHMAAAKAALFFAALEDAYGEAAVRSGLAEVVAVLHGKEVGFDDLRAALEQSTGKNLAEPFRTWLYNKGIPQEFRERYASAEK